MKALLTIALIALATSLYADNYLCVILREDIKDKLKEKDKVTILSCGLNPSTDLLAAGYEPIPVEVTP